MAFLAISLIWPGAGATARQRVQRVWVPVLIYHHVKPFRSSDDAIERGLTIPPAQFRREIAYLVAHRFHVLTAAHVVDSLLKGRGLPSRPVVLSFDDGYSDMATNVVPVLRHNHMQATFFIASGLLNRPRYLTWKQVKAMAGEGIDIEAHTVSHPDLTLVPPSQLRGEIYGCRQTLQSRLHRSVHVFAYPYGEYNAYVLQTVHRAGFVAAFTTHQGWSLDRHSVLTLPRVYIDNDDSLSIFAGRLTANRSILAQDPT